MIKDLIKLANKLDEVGLDKYSDRIDLTIERLKKEAQQTNYFDQPLKGSGYGELAYDVARSGAGAVIPVVAPFGGAATDLSRVSEMAADIASGKGLYESTKPLMLRSVEEFMARKQGILKSSKDSLAASIDAVKSEATRLSEDQLKQKIKEVTTSMDSWSSGSWTTPNYYRNLQREVGPKIYQMSWALGFKMAKKPSKADVGLESVVDNLSSNVTSWFDTDYREAGRWIMWQLVQEGFKDGFTEKSTILTTPPPHREPPGPGPLPTPVPQAYLEPIKIIHPAGSVILDGNYTYDIISDLKFHWKRENKEGIFVPNTISVEKWNDAAKIINSLPVSTSVQKKPGEVTPTQPDKTQVNSDANLRDNVIVVLLRTEKDAYFALSTLQNERKRLRDLIKDSGSVASVADKILVEDKPGLIGLPLASVKTEDLNKMSNKQILDTFKTEVGLIMRAINRLYDAKPKK